MSCHCPNIAVPVSLTLALEWPIFIGEHGKHKASRPGPGPVVLCSLLVRPLGEQT